jgi:hypothetical protein
VLLVERAGFVTDWKGSTTLKLVIGAAAALCALAVAIAPAGAGTRLSKAQYIAKLRTANATSSKAENAAVAALQSKKTTTAQVRARFLAMGRTKVRIGESFARVLPPKAAAKANRDFSHAEVVLGRQNEAIARKLPATKPAIAKYLQSLKPPSGGAMLDRAIAELHAAGFKI